MDDKKEICTIIFCLLTLSRYSQCVMYDSKEIRINKVSRQRVSEEAHTIMRVFFFSNGRLAPSQRGAAGLDSHWQTSAVGEVKSSVSSCVYVWSMCAWILQYCRLGGWVYCREGRGGHFDGAALLLWCLKRKADLKTHDCETRVRS